MYFLVVFVKNETGPVFENIEYRKSYVCCGIYILASSEVIRLVTVLSYGAFIVLPHWEDRVATAHNLISYSVTSSY